MSNKKLTLFVLLSLFSVTAGGAFGLLDIFGFVDGRHSLSLVFLALSIVLIYLILITVFILNFARQSRIGSFFIIASLLFGVTFYLMNLNIFLSLFASLLYFAFLMYAFTTSRERSKNQIKFAPSQIFLPILRNSVIYLLVLVSAIAFTQSKELVSNNSLIHPALVKIVARPAVFTLNKQLNNQVSNQLKVVPDEIVNDQGKKSIVRLILEKTVDTTAESNSGDIYGFKPEEIPVQLVNVDDGGNINIEPMIDAMLPQIATKLNEFVQKYAFIAPFFVALLTFLILQPFMIIINSLEFVMTLAIFKLLIATKFIKIKKEPSEIERLSI